MRPQQLTLPSRQSLLHGTTENHKPEQVQIITIYNCSTKRWIVERTFAWLNWSRRLSKDYQLRHTTAETMIYVAFAHLLLRRAASF
jgi:transposase